MRTTTGLSTEAVFIFNNMLRKLAKTLRASSTWRPFSRASGKTHREEEFAEYKANRAETPPDLGEQIPYIRRLLRSAAHSHPAISAASRPTTSSARSPRRAEAAGFEVVIVSSDKDMLQLVTDRVSMLNPAKDDTWYDPAKVEGVHGR